jgi:integrase
MKHVDILQLNKKIKIYLSQIDTNHSIRATGATILGRNCSMAQIMAVTGHKSVSSVAVYQRASSKEIKLWETLSQVLFVGCL